MRSLLSAPLKDATGALFFTAGVETEAIGEREGAEEMAGKMLGIRVRSIKIVTIFMCFSAVSSDMLHLGIFTRILYKVKHEFH